MSQAPFHVGWFRIVARRHPSPRDMTGVRPQPDPSHVLKGHFPYLELLFREVPELPADDEGAALHHEAAHVADAAGDRDGAALHRDTGARARVALHEHPAAADRRAGARPRMAPHDDRARHHVLAQAPAAVPSDLDVAAVQHARAVPADRAVEHDPKRLQNRYAEVVARGGVLDEDLALRLFDQPIDLAGRLPRAIDDRRLLGYRSHQRTSPAASSCGTRRTSGNAPRIATSSDASTTNSSVSAQSMGFVAKGSRATPIPSSVETRYANVPSSSRTESRSASSSVAPSSSLS